MQPPLCSPLYTLLVLYSCPDTVGGDIFPSLHEATLNDMAHHFCIFLAQYIMQIVHVIMVTFIIIRWDIRELVD